jgi:hypothetical protein
MGFFKKLKTNFKTKPLQASFWLEEAGRRIGGKEEKMEPWEITIEQAKREADELRKRRKAADREDAYLFAQQLAEDEKYRTIKKLKNEKKCRYPKT